MGKGVSPKGLVSKMPKMKRIGTKSMERTQKWVIVTSRKMGNARRTLETAKTRKIGKIEDYGNAGS